MVTLHLPDKIEPVVQKMACDVNGVQKFDLFYDAYSQN